MKYENLEASFYYHIYNQGNNRENIFFEEKNYKYFLRLLNKYISPLAEIYAYCLLPNHFHILLRINDAVPNRKCSQAFSNFFNAYAKAINKVYQRSGSLFKRKFSRIKVKNEDYLIKLVLYIHTNAQHHGIIDAFEAYPHSYYKAYFSPNTTNISKDYILSLFEDIQNFAFAHKMKSDQLEEQFNEYTLE